MRLLSVCSARPNFVKLAAIEHALLKDRPDIEHIIVHTGQHYDPLLSDVFFQELAIPQPKKNLGIHGGSREEMIHRTTQALLPVLDEYKPDWVLVYGDVNGALGAARAAQELGIKIAHVEAGLRSGDLDMPEEHNRIGIDAIADVLFCTEQAAVDHLRKEKVPGSIRLVGNTMIDTLLQMSSLIEKEEMPIDIDGTYGVVTLHRPSNVDDRKTLTAMMEFLGEAAARSQLVIPVHHRLRLHLQEFDLMTSVPNNIRLIESLGYIPFLRLMKDAAFVLTDSGGIQEEAVLLQKRCFTLRRNTERPVTIESGSNVLIDPAKEEDRKKVLDFAAEPQPPEVKVPPLWDGNAGKRIVDLLAA